MEVHDADSEQLLHQHTIEVVGSGAALELALKSLEALLKNVVLGLEIFLGVDVGREFVGRNLQLLG